MEIKDLLKTGQTTPEQLMQDLKDQISTAQKEIADEKKAEQEKKAKENKKEKTLRDTRKACADSIIKYLMELNLIDNSMSNEDVVKVRNDFCKSLESYEKALKDFQPFKDDFEKILHEDFHWDWDNWPDNTIINTFVKSLCL